MTVVTEHSGKFISISGFGTRAYDQNKNIVGINGMTLKVEHLSDQKGELTDYFIAWVDGVQADGETHNQAVENALEKRHTKSYQLGQQNY